MTLEIIFLLKINIIKIPGPTLKSPGIFDLENET